MARVTIEAQGRSDTGKGAARQLRRQGLVPAVVYGHGEETRHLQVESKDLERFIVAGGAESQLIDLKMDGETAPVLIREIQVHPYKPELLHVDFLMVHKGEKLHLEIPVRLIGSAPGVKEGGILEHMRRELEVRCEPAAIPEALEVDISELGIGDSVNVEDIRVPPGVEIQEEPNRTVAAVVPPTVIKEPEPEEEELEVELLEGEEEAEPEVVGRGKAADEEGEGEAEEEEGS